MAEKILVVDDEREIADLVTLYLKNEGYETLVCYNGQEALEQIQANGGTAAATCSYAAAWLDKHPQ